MDIFELCWESMALGPLDTYCAWLQFAELYQVWLGHKKELACYKEVEGKDGVF